MFWNPEIPLPALLKQILYGPDHAEIFKIVEPAALRREHQARPSGMTVNLESHHPVKMIAVFVIIRCMHVFYSLVMVKLTNSIISS